MLGKATHCTCEENTDWQSLSTDISDYADETQNQYKGDRLAVLMTRVIIFSFFSRLK